MSKYRKALPEDAVKYIPVEVPPGSYLIRNADSANINGLFLPYWITVLEPMVLWERWLNKPVDGKEKWTRGTYGSMADAPKTYTIPSWWRKLWRNVEAPAVPFARVVTR